MSAPDPSAPVVDREGWRGSYRENLANTFGVPQELLVRGEGCHVWSADGKRYLDCLAGIAVNALGHAHPAVVAAISAQAAQVVHVSNLFASRPQIALAQRLCELSGAGAAGRVFFANSGAEANEAAFKLARLHGGAARPRVLALENGFHGRTMGALALTGKPAMREPFAPMPGGVEHIPASLAALEAAFGDDPGSIAALFVEPIQGEAGVVPLPDGFLRRARELTAAAGALLVVDEIQTGVGRTGAWFAFQHEGVVPDAMTLAKGLGGGVPIGALVTFGAASALFTPGVHGSTFGGNPFATAVAGAVLAELERINVLDAVVAEGAALRSALLGLRSPLVAGVRGRGLLLGVALTQPVAQRVAAVALELGLIVNAPNAETIRLAPPLVFGAAERVECVAMLGEAFARVLAV